ncbi:NodT family efflux transporter outer membrane factor (OMF) lipoprotein [Polynucleobacter sphagniphilus]|nr:NodT family efflux transporter outer membrane factor (OMF) lipoprotein [Polynucleobacter sphagniphilus]
MCMWANVQVNKHKPFFIILLALFLGSCAVGPDFVSPQAPEGAAYLKNDEPWQTIRADGKTQMFHSGTWTDANWWMMFQSETLNAEVEQALKQNPSLLASEASLKQSQDLMRAGYGVFFPQVSVGLGASRIANAPMQLGSAAPGSIFNLLTASASVSYVLDIFGGERRQVEALRAQVDYQKYSTNAAYLMLSANVVNTSIARAGYLEEIKVTEELITLEKEQLKVAQAQVTGGTAAYATVLSIQSLIASNEASIASLRQRVSQAEHLLAALEGVDPSHVTLSTITLESLTLPADIPVTLPSDLVRNRPDILAAEAQMHVASANIGVATAEMFPSVSLSATYGVASNTFSSLSGPSQQFWSAGPGISIPIFKGGSLYYARQASLDAYEQTQASYKQIVLNAFAEVADCLTALVHDAQAVQGQLDAKTAAAEALKLMQINYNAGLVDYLSVLIADVQYHQASIAYVQALAQRYQDTVALYVALGGGWGEVKN